MSDKEWDKIMEVHLKGALSCTKAAWPLFRKQKFTRVINCRCVWYLLFPDVFFTKNAGNFGQAHYSATKMGLVAFSKTLAPEGAKYNIKSTVIAPVRYGIVKNKVMTSMGRWPPPLCPDYPAP